MQHTRHNKLSELQWTLDDRGGHVKLNKMLVYVKTKVHAPDMKIFQVMYKIYRDVTTKCVITHNNEIFVNTTTRRLYLSSQILWG